MSDADRERIKNKYPDSYTRIDAIINLEAQLAESQRRELDYQEEIANYRLHLGGLKKAKDYETVMLWIQAGLHGMGIKTHEGFGKFEVETLREQVVLLRDLAQEAHEYMQYEPRDLVSDEYRRLRQAAIDGGALEDE